MKPTPVNAMVTTPPDRRNADPLATWATVAVAALGAAALAALGGCANPGVLPPAQATLSPQTLGLATDGGTAFPSAEWWRDLGDARLDALVNQALAGQPGLQQAAARVARADAAARLVQAAQQPQAGASFDWTRQRFTEHGLVPPPIAGSVRDSANLQLSGSVELDFFGRHAAALRSAIGQQRAAQADQQAARVLLASNVSRGYVALARLFAQREVAERTLAQREALQALTRQRVQAGLDTQLELKQAEVGIPDARSQIEALDEQIALTRHQLAALSGQAPDALDRLRPALAPLRTAVAPERLGADLLGRRADIVAARWRIEASAADVAVARTQFYPDINLVGFVGLNALGLDNLLNLGSRNLGIGPAVRLPVFDAGRLRAQLQGRAADADAAVAAYNAVVLDALREAADAGTTLRSLVRQLAEQQQALDHAEAAYDIATQRYRAGLGSFLQVLTAETAVLAQRRQTTDLRARQLDAQVQLARALGGGWVDTDAPPARQAGDPAGAAAVAAAR